MKAHRANAKVNDKLVSVVVLYYFCQDVCVHVSVDCISDGSPCFV
jgi:hypothetical protein